MKNLYMSVCSALFAALVCIATMIIKISTPTFGYIHLGDGMVLLCGIFCGPAAGALAAGTGSAFADLFSGYAAWAPATFLIKALTAGCCGLAFRHLSCRKKTAHAYRIAAAISGLLGEIVMITGYFFYEAALAASFGGLTKTSLAAGAASAASGIPFNAIQGITGIVVCCLLMPVLLKIPSARMLLEPVPHCPQESSPRR